MSSFPVTFPLVSGLGWAAGGFQMRCAGSILRWTHRFDSHAQLCHRVHLGTFCLLIDGGERKWAGWQRALIQAACTAQAAGSATTADAIQLPSQAHQGPQIC